MAPTTDADGSEDVNDFLLRIRELGEKRDKEDEERTRKLEEEILQGRKERQARRAGKTLKKKTRDCVFPSLVTMGVSSSCCSLQHTPLCPYLPPFCPFGRIAMVSIIPQA